MEEVDGEIILSKPDEDRHYKVVHIAAKATSINTEEGR
jgi:hypothetical protein